MALPNGLRGVPGQLTTDVTTVPGGLALRAIAAIPEKAKAERSAALLEASIRQGGGDPEQEDDVRLLREIRDRKGQLEPEQTRMAEAFRRFDNLYYPDFVGDEGGADHWPEGRKGGRVHTSLNDPPIYVDIPASLQAVPPVENYASAGVDDEERAAAARAERIYFQWKEESDFELEVHKGCIVKALYGFTFGKVYWDPIERIPRVRILDQPEGLYVGWGDSDYRRMDWTIFCYGLSPQAAEETYGVTTLPIKVGGSYYPFVTNGTHDDPLGTVNYKEDFREARIRTAYEETHVEVYDYWYKKPKGKGKRPEVWNAIFVGNQLVEHARHREYDELPYVPLPNTYIPGSPYGRPELFDLEQLFREKDERISEAGQMIHSIVGGQMFQLVGPEAPDEVPTQAIPKPGKVSAPGPGNELKAIQPFVPQFAIEDHLKRLDLEKESISGLNELLIGRAPATILGSSKAITALVANYEARIRMKRDLLYRFRKEVWKRCAVMWERKDSDIASLIDGRHRLTVIAPELTPRDALENAQKAINLVQNRLWSMERAMDATGVEDPEEEKNLVRAEQTDPALNPTAVQTQVSLAAAMQQLGIQPGQGAPTTPAQNANTARTLNRPAAGTSSLNGPENEANPPPESLPANAQPGAKAQVQTIVQGGEADGRILTQTPLGEG